MSLVPLAPFSTSVEMTSPMQLPSRAIPVERKRKLSLSPDEFAGLPFSQAGWNAFRQLDLFCG
jgi:hypothetical protein